MADCLSLPDGTRVSLPGVTVDAVSVDASYVFVKDLWAENIRLPIALSTPIDAFPDQVLDVEGTLATHASGMRVLMEPRLRAYTDAYGHIVYVPVPKGWPWRTDVYSSGAFGTMSSNWVQRLTQDPPPEMPPGGSQGGSSATTAPPGSIAYAKTSEDTTVVNLTGKIVTRIFSDCFYIQEPVPGGAGIRVMDNNADVHPGYIIDLTNGTMSTGADGERQISGSYSAVSSGTVSPVNMTGRSFYCGPLIVDDTSRTIVEAQGVTDGVGVHHIGTLARASGTITEKGSDYLYLWDGSTTPDNLEMTDGIGTGIRVQFPSGGASVLPVDEDDFISFSGISGLREVNGDHLPVMKASWRDAKISIGPLDFGPCDDIGKITATASICDLPIKDSQILFWALNSDVSHTPTGPWESSLSGYTDTVGEVSFYFRPHTIATQDTLSFFSDGGIFLSHDIDLMNLYNVDLTTSRHFLNNVESIITVSVTDTSGMPVAGIFVTLESDIGYFDNTVGLDVISGYTNSHGLLETTYKSDDCGTFVNIAVTAIAQPCNAMFTSELTVFSFCSEPAPFVDVFWCLDTTGSMQQNGFPIQSVEKFLEDMAEEGIPIRSGGVKFNEDIYNEDKQKFIDYINPEQIFSLGDFYNEQHFISSWLWNGYAESGGDPEELQLDALMIAADDIDNNSPLGNPFRYVVLITDIQYHEEDDHSDLTRQQVKEYLENVGSKVYISLMVHDPTQLWNDYYKTLAVDGAYDPISSSHPRYPLYELKSRIVSEWYSQ